MRPELLVVDELPPFYDKVTFIYKKNYFLLICINSRKKIDESKFVIFLWLRKHIIDTSEPNEIIPKRSVLSLWSVALQFFFFFLFPCSGGHINSKHHDKWFSKLDCFFFSFSCFWNFLVIVIYLLMHAYFMKTASWKVFLVCLYYVCRVLQAISYSWTCPWWISTSSHRVYWFVSVNVE